MKSEYWQGKNNPNWLAQRRVELVQEIEKIDKLVADYKELSGFDLFTIGKKGNPGKWVQAVRAVKKSMEGSKSDDLLEPKVKVVRAEKKAPRDYKPRRRHVPQICQNIDSCPKPERKFKSKGVHCKYCSRYCRDHYNRILRVNRQKAEAKAEAKAESKAHEKGVPLVKGDPLTASGFADRGRL